MQCWVRCCCFKGSTSNVAHPAATTLQVHTVDESLSAAAHGPEARRQAFGLAGGAADASWRSRSGPGNAQGAGAAPGTTAGGAGGAGDAAGQALDILSFEQRKAARASGLRALMQPGSPGGRVCPPAFDLLRCQIWLKTLCPLWSAWAVRLQGRQPSRVAHSVRSFGPDACPSGAAAT
jgi:hypothetical protein